MRRHCSPAKCFLLWLGLSITAGSLHAQPPVIDPGGIVNGGSYARPETPGSALAPGSIAVIFGENLAPESKAAEGFPLPFEMVGVRVSFGDLPAALFEVSPRQLRVQVPSGVLPLGFCCTRNIPVRVATPQGVSGTVDVVVTPHAPAFLTQNGAPCGAGRVLNLSTEVPYRTPGPEDSAWPGDWLRVYLTGLGLVFDMPPDGTPAGPAGQPSSLGGAGVLLGARSWGAKTAFVGKAPGLVGVDLVEFQLPEDVPEGCRIPFRLRQSYATQPIPLSIRRGGGPCVPNVASLGFIEWKRSVWNTGGSADTLRFRLNAGEANGFPLLADADRPAPTEFYVPSGGPECPDLLPKGLDAGALTFQGANLPPIPMGAPPAVGGESTFTLPAPLTAGRYSVTAAGGADVGAFSSELTIPEPIRVTTRLAPGDVIRSDKSFTVRWSGGDDNSVVMVRLISWQAGAQRVALGTALASKGEVVLPAYPVGSTAYLLNVFSSGSAEIVVTQTPSRASLATFTADGLSLGGQHRWAYEFHFENMRVDKSPVTPP